MSLARKLRYLAQAHRFQWKGLGEIRAHQYQKLREMLEYVETRIPLYRERFHAAGVKAADLRSLEDLRHFPIIRREEIIARLDAFAAQALATGPVDQTGGAGAPAETVFVLPSLEFSHFSSRHVKEIAAFGGDIARFLPPEILPEVEARLRPE